MKSDTLGDDLRVIATAQAARDGHRTAASARSCGELAGLGAMARGVAEVGLAVSGLRSDPPRGPGSLISRRQASVRKNVPLQEELANGRKQAEHPTFCGPAEGLRFGRTAIGLQRGRFP
jgi:hypothetical protein